MGLFSRKTKVVDLITSEDLATYGKHEFLGASQSGIDPSTAWSLIEPLARSVWDPTGPTHEMVVAELTRHAEKGEWEKVGALEFARNVSSEGDFGQLIDGGLMALHRMRVTNLAVHLAPMFMGRYQELTGGPPPNDGFFGPPVFDSSYGPTRQYYFDHALAAAASRSITRVPSSPGVDPGPIGDDARNAMWDFGLLVHRGPLVVNPDITFEPNVVRPAVEAARDVDHAVFADRLAEAVLDRESHAYGAWSAMGASRFIEDYLDRSAVETEGARRLLDEGIHLLTAGALLDIAMPADILTPRQRERLAAIRGQ